MSCEVYVSHLLELIERLFRAKRRQRSTLNSEVMFTDVSSSNVPDSIYPDIACVVSYSSPHRLFTYLHCLRRHLPVRGYQRPSLRSHVRSLVAS